MPEQRTADGEALQEIMYSKFYVTTGKIAGWISAVAFVLALVNKLRVSEWLFTPSDLLQAALYLVLFAIFASMAAISSK